MVKKSAIEIETERMLDKIIAIKNKDLIYFRST